MEKNIVINAQKAGNTINLFLNGRMRKKVCDTAATAKEFYELILKVKANPTQEGVNEILGYLNEKTRIAMKCGLETDPETGNVYMAGFNTPVPATLVDVVKEYHENDYPLDAIFNFWKLLMLNPDTRVRENLFDFITAHDFVLTDSGYMIVYKAVTRVSDTEDVHLRNFIEDRYDHVKNDWKKHPKWYMIYRNEDGELHITKVQTVENWDLETKNVEILGNLSEMYDNIDEVTKTNPGKYPFTDNFTHKMKIRIGEAVKKERKNCDADPRRDCSNGLHCGATSYVESFANRNDAILACFVNPAHVVAVPDYDHTKFRTCEYYPFAEVLFENNKIEIIDQAYFESDYSHYEKEELEKMVEALRSEEAQLPIETAQNAEEETRSMAELEKIVKNRLVDLSVA